jgi:uncharacterized membrane protein
MTTLLIFYVAGGALLVLIAIPLLFEKIPPNLFYGFRVPQTLANPRVWYATNKFAAKRLIWAGAGFILAAIVFYFIPGITVDEYAIGCLVVFGGIFLAGFIQSMRYLRMIVRQQD